MARSSPPTSTIVRYAGTLSGTQAHARAHPVPHPLLLLEVLSCGGAAEGGPPGKIATRTSRTPTLSPPPAVPPPPWPPQVFNVPGRCYPVDVIHTLEDHQSDYVDAAIDTVMQIHCNQPEGGTGVGGGRYTATNQRVGQGRAWAGRGWWGWGGIGWW